MYGPLQSNGRGVPAQDVQIIDLLAERFQRAYMGQREWAIAAKKCVEFVEGKQWSAQDLKVMEEIGKAPITINKVGPLIRLVQGYYRNNRSDEKFLPSADDSSTEETALAITKLAKQISEVCQQPYIDAEVFGDGIITGRGFYDLRLGFEENILGEAAMSAQDPFSTYIDPDAKTYDPNPGPGNAGWGYAFTTSWASLNDIKEGYGDDAATLVEPLITGGAYTNGLPASIIEQGDEITPWRNFGGETNEGYANYGHMGDYLSNIVDPVRKTIRVVDQQHYVRTRMKTVVDLETGLFKPLPDSWDDTRIQRFFDWSAYKAEETGRANPLRYEVRALKRLRWTVCVGDILIHDDWSPYKSMTIIPFFPYFRRGQTRGMVDDLIAPQEQINANRSTAMDMQKRTANGGWLYADDALDEEQEAHFAEFGASTGFMGAYKAGKEKPTQVFPSPPNQKAERLEAQATDDLNEVSGINQDLMGMDEKVKSGRAIEARQRQGVLSIQVYMDNKSRTKELVARKKLELIQNHYREQRLVRIQGDDGKPDTLFVNERVSDRIINDVSLGKYRITIDETPLSASFHAAQFEELIDMIERGILPIEAVQDIAVDLSSIGNKDLLKQRVQQVMAAKGIMVGDEAGLPGMQQGQPQPPLIGQGDPYAGQ